MAKLNVGEKLCVSSDPDTLVMSANDIGLCSDYVVFLQQIILSNRPWSGLYLIHVIFNDQHRKTSRLVIQQ